MLQYSSGCLRRGGGGNTARWVQQQANDPFVIEARMRGYVARSALKLAYLDDRFHLFRADATTTVVDLGCSPGGWCQVIRERAGDGCRIIGIDLLSVKANITNATFVQGDFTQPVFQERLRQLLQPDRVMQKKHVAHDNCDGSAREGCVDVVTSDMCPNRVGGTQDRQRTAALCNEALRFALPLLQDGGHFLCKVLGSRASFECLYDVAVRHFASVQLCKPPASRVHSDESFLVALSKLGTETLSINTHTKRGTNGRFGLDDWPGMQRRYVRRPKPL